LRTLNPVDPLAKVMRLTMPSMETEARGGGREVEV